jgi:FKBP-type peptidyl-prolyl cis-trans isomerase FkpA
LSAIAFAALMVACGGNPNQVGVTKGSKSQMDTLSYSLGIDFVNGATTNVPELKFAWATLADEAAKSMLKKEAYEDDKLNEENIKILEEFFTKTRPERMQKYMEENKPDSVERLSYQEQMALISKFDIFESEEERETVSKAYGYDLGARYRMIRIPLQAYWFAQAIKDFTVGEGAKMSSDEASNYLMTYQMNVLPKQNKAASEAWLAKIEKKRGVKKTESGLLYKIENEGDVNNKPTADGKVKAHYEGKLRDGVVFDSSYERGEPIEFPLNGVIKGWSEGIQLIGQGGKITLWIPSELAYGESGAGMMIAPNEALEFTVELVEVVSETPAAPAEVPAE